MSENKEIFEQLNKTYEFMKEADTKRAEEIKTVGEGLGETREKLEKITNDLVELDLAMKKQHLAVEVGAEVDDILSKQNEVMEKFLRKGEKSLNDEEFKILIERKDMISSNDTTGGFLQSEDMRQEIIKNILEYSPVRQVARITSTSKNEIKIPKRTGNITGGVWAGEVAARTDLGNITYGMLNIPVHTLTGYVDISNDNLDDSDFDLSREIALELGELFGITEGGVFISGNGVNKPLGFTDTKSGITTVANGHATALQADAVKKLPFEVKSAYRKNGIYMLNRGSIKEVFLLTDSNNQYLWKPGLSEGAPSLINGHKFVEATDMPDIAADALAIAFGDFREGYQIVDRKAFTIDRDAVTQRGNNLTRFYGTKRVGGQVRKAEALRLLKIEA